jgi:hypothetical protein
MFCFLQEEVMASHVTRRQAMTGTCCAAALSFLAPSIAFAAKRFSVVSLVNETQANLTISYRWAQESWKQVRLTPGAREMFVWPYSKPDEDRSPDLHVTFDADSSASKYAEAKKLRGFAAEEQNFDLGHKYSFRYDGPSKRYIELWDISPPGVPASSRPPQGKRID